ETAEKQFAANAPAGRDIASSLATDAHKHGLDDETLYEILEGQYGRTDTVLPAFNPARERALKERTREIYNEALQQWQAMEPLRKFQQANPKLMKHFAEGGDEAYIPKFHEYAYKFKDMGGWDVDEENVVDLFTTNPGKRMTLAEARHAAIQEAGLDEMKAPAFLDEA